MGEQMAVATKNYEVITPVEGAPIFNWAADVESGALAQAQNLARLPFVIHHVAMMPDAHQGYGMPIGGVLFADRVVVPYAIGVDIGCGVIFQRTNLERVDVTDERLTKVLAFIKHHVPVGFATRYVDDKEAATIALVDNIVGGDWSKFPGGAIKNDWLQGATGQMGTLGGGNHFIEVQADQNGDVAIMIHSGSRSLGKKICDEYHAKALNLNRLWFSDLPDKELAYLPIETVEARDYWTAMEFALLWAERNRQTMMAHARNAFGSVFGPNVFEEGVDDVHHNYAAWENHYGKNGIVHRKGAVRARQGETVLIPGSMGTATYVAKGLGNRESFETCQHGAGRAMSRGATRKAWTAEDVLSRMAEAGVQLVSGDPSKSMEEYPEAYKDIEQVMLQSTDLVEPVGRLTPLGVVKG